MNTLRGTITSAALAGLLGFALTGCGTSTDSDTAGGTSTAAATTAPADPKTALIASLKELKTGNYALRVDSPETKVTGSVHVPSKSGALKMDVTSDGSSFTMELVGAAPDRWVRISSSDAAIQQLLGSDGKTWSHIDTSKVAKGGGLDIDVTNADLLGVEALLQGVTAVKGDARTIAGTIDATKVNADDGFLDDDAIKAMGAGASSLPFTATLDGQGRLTKLVIDAPKAGDTPAGKWAYTISGYGEQKAQTKPAGAIKEMSAKQLEMLNS
ncbi:hypothetical protein [Paractinoplanes toevensis]|uniref:Lipoprotein n=1 Tax=Paractinoplanes toevensis TaxID=571911 RepID=A0A919THN5_9ACTN|nr:hypothetical protein [Actinoplanes toevensis]GIM95715.1 hypothetical protein Ato02nite_075080 [Actinoplanes toevensis]